MYRIHPHNADRWNDDYRSKLEALIRRNRQSIVALGEAGLDYDRMFSARGNQKKCFSDILEMAGDLDLPLFLHERAAEQDFIRLLKNRRELCRRSVVHCFTGTREHRFTGTCSLAVISESQDGYAMIGGTGMWWRQSG